MTLIILAAGEGSRLRPFTDDRPKCLVPVGDHPILEWQLAAARAAGVDAIVVVRGYRSDRIQYDGVAYVENPRYAVTNMVETLWCAESFFDGGFIMAYGDIIYEPDVLRMLMRAPGPTAAVVDRAWQSYWEQRVDDVLSDAESLEVSDDGRILGIGQRARSIADIQAQYIGLVKFDVTGVADLRSAYAAAQAEAADGRHPFRGQRPFERLYMTDLLQGMIDRGAVVRETPIAGHWLEIDTPRDREVAERSLIGHPEDFSIRRSGAGT